MTAPRFFLLLALLALSLAGCQGVPNLLSIVVDKPENRIPDPANSYDPYGLQGRSTVPDNRAPEHTDNYDPYGLLARDR